MSFLLHRATQKATRPEAGRSSNVPGSLSAEKRRKRYTTGRDVALLRPKNPGIVLTVKWAALTKTFLSGVNLGELMETILINLGGLLGILVIAGFSIKSNMDINNKISGTYKRMDKVKEDFEEKHVRKDVCAVVHAQLSRDVTEIKKDVKTLLQGNGYDTRHNE